MRTRSEIKFWETDPQSPDIPSGSHTLSHSSPNSKTQELSVVEQRRESIGASLGDQAAAAGKSKEREEETKGEEGDRSRS